ncbi:MAG: hypothetical protein AAGH19_04060 [Pseudomonadota bacterium]
MSAELDMKEAVPSTKGRTALRWILAGPVTLIGAVLAMAITPFMLPAGASGVGHLVFAIVLFPLFWAVLFFYAVLTERLGRAALVFTAFYALSAVLIWQAFAGS